MDSQPISNDYPVYKAIGNNNRYFAMNDIFAFCSNQIILTASQMNQPLPREAKKFLDGWEKRLAGSFEFVSASTWESIKLNYDKDGASIMKALCSENAHVRCMKVINAIKDGMRTHPGVFLPNQNDKKTKIVRLFKDGKDSFAMADEVLYAIGGHVFKKDPLDNWETVDFRNVLEAAKRYKFEIVVAPVQRIGSYCPLMRTPDGTFVRFAAEVLLFVARNVALQANIFNQKYGSYQEKLAKFIAELKKQFPLDEKNRIFMTKERFQAVMKFTNDTFEDVTTPVSKKKINEKKQAKMEVKQMKQLYSSGNRTVAHFFSLHPTLSEFFHNQKGCDLLTLNRCPWCPVEKKVQPEEQTFEEEAMEILRGIERRKREVEEHTELLRKLYNADNICKPVLISPEKTTIDEKKKKKNNKKKAASTPKVSETSEVPVQVPESKVPETTDSSESADSTDAPTTSDSESEETIKPSESRCLKCSRTSMYCEEAKEKLKTSQNTVKRLEKKLSEKEKLMEEMKMKMQEELDALKRQMEEMKEQQRLETERMTKENQELKDKNAELEEAIKEKPKSVESEPSEAPMSREERSDMIWNLRDKDMELKCGTLWKEVDMKVLSLIITKPDVQKMAQSAHNDFKVQHDMYSEAVKATLQLLRANETIYRSQLPKLPDYPKLSEVFNTEYQKMLDEAAELKKKKETETECSICLEVVEKNEKDLFQCPVCKKLNHWECVGPWFKISDTCPSCRAQWS